MSLRWRYEGWRKLYIREEGSFAQLPLYTRAFAAELLKFADNRGRIALAGKAPHDAIAMRAGATRGDRRMIKRDIELLLKDQYLVLEGDELVIKNFLRAHPHLEADAAAQVVPPVSAPVVAPVAVAVAAPVVPPPPEPAPVATPEPTRGELIEPYAASPSHHEQLNLQLSGIEPTTTVQRNSSDVVETPALQSEDPRQIRDDKREEARRLAAIEVELLTQMSPTPLGPRAGVEKKIHALLLSGWTFALLEEALHATAAEAREKKTLKWWNGVDNWKDDSVRRALANKRPILRPVKMPTPEPPDTPPTPEPRRSPDEMRKMMNDAWADAAAHEARQ